MCACHGKHLRERDNAVGSNSWHCDTEVCTESTLSDIVTLCINLGEDGAAV